jgi:predicted component of type VI protein secretion system
LSVPRGCVLAIVAALAGCGGGQKATPGKPRLTLSVTPSRTTNHGRTLHALVRTVVLKQFVEDQYRNVAQLVPSPDDSVLSAFVVFPGVAQTITIDRPAKGAIAVYFLFTGAAGTTWKQMFDVPPSAIRIELGDDEILKVTSTPAKP